MTMATLLIGTLVGLQAPTLVDTVFTVGTREGSEEESFARVTDAVLGPDGMLFVVDVAEPHVRVFDRDGEFVRMFGRRGQGPGELIRPTNAAWLDSTLIVRHNRALTEFRQDGEFVRLARPAIRGWLSMALPISDGEHVILKDGVGRRTGIDQEQELRVVDGTTEERLAVGVSGTVFHRGPNVRGALVTGVCGTLSIAYTGSGTFIVGDGERGELKLYRGREIVERLAVASEAGRIPPDIEGKVVELAGRTRWGRSGEPHQLTFPPLFSTICDVQAESAERAWFRRNAFRDDPEEWQAVDLETGALTESFRLESGVKVQSIRDGRVAAVWHDDLGVSYVTVFALPEG